MPQAVSCWSFIAEARLRSEAQRCEICSGQSGTGTGSAPSTPNVVAQMLHIHVYLQTVVTRTFEKGMFFRASHSSG
jgi:copper homeostasis protein CutC